MFINKSNQLYKPERILYYIDADEKLINDFYNGIIPEIINKHANAFGTYDYPGLFFTKKLDKFLLGIEYRLHDKKIDYPTDLKTMILEENFYYSIEVDDEVVVDQSFINDMFARIKLDDDAHRLYTDLVINDNYSLISMFSTNGKTRILYEMRITRDSAINVIKDYKDKLDRKFLYNMSFIDPITNHYNWNHILPFLEMPADYGIKDYVFVHFDVKEFRIINEVYGHIAANRVLCNIVKKMKSMDYVYTSARCHNDNFCMIIKDMPEDEIIEKLKDFFADLSHLEEDPYYTICYRCGVVPMQRSMLSGNRVADAGKLAQKLGVNNNKTDIIIYTDEMHDDIVWSNYIKAYLDTAISNDEFVVFLQPKFDIQKNELKGAEALIRWDYKKKRIT